jgi:HD-GYP domain-containing protein (c-di-GMP phosphodiesterase class II)
MTSAATSAVAERAQQAATLDPEVESRVEAVRKTTSERLSNRSRRASLTVAVLFVGSVAALALLVHSHRSPSLLTIAALVVTYALASRVEFEVRTGFALPTELVLVPMLFLLPLGYVPLFVLLGLLLAGAPELLRRRVPLSRALLVVPNSWHAVAPAAVLALAGESPARLGHWPLYAGALAAQFAFDFARGAAHDWYVNGVSPASQLPFIGWAFLVDTALAPIGLLVAVATSAHPQAVLLVLPLVALLGEFARERKARIDHGLELNHAYRGTAMLLGDVVEADDAYTGTHSRDVVELVLDVADLMELNARDRRDAEFAALLHDIGKIRIPAEVINKPGKLSDEEWVLMKQHTIEGEKLLGQVGGLLGNVGRIVRHCHEDWDGTGYPDGLEGNEIPLVARIVRVCDAFSAMTTDRSYRQARPAEEALVELRRCAGTDFDPVVVTALAAAVSARP